MSTPTLVERTECPVCRSRTSRTLVDLDYGEDPIRGYLLRFYAGGLDPDTLMTYRYRIEECTGCRVVYQRFVPGDALLERLYGPGGVAVSEGADRGLETRIGFAHQIEQLLRHFDCPPAQVRVLDFGSGCGDWLAMASAFGCSTAGSELAEAALAQIESDGHEAFAAGSLPEEGFDFINTEQVVEHVLEPRSCVEQLATALRPGGLLRISVPNGAGIEDRLGLGRWDSPKSAPDSLNPVAPLEHVNCFSPSSLSGFGERVGLRPFEYPWRVELHPLARIRFAGGAVRRRIARPATTAQLFLKPG